MAFKNANPDNARVWGSDDDFVAVAPLEAEFTLPATIDTEAPAPFKEVGWLHPDGFTLNPNDEIQKFKGFQGGRVVRTKVTSSETSIQFQLLESTALTMGIALDVTESTAEGAVTKHTLPGSREVDARQWLIGLFDGDVKWLLHIPRGEIGERAEVKLGSEELTAWNVTVEIIGDAYLYTEGDLAMTAGGGGTAPESYSTPFTTDAD